MDFTENEFLDISSKIPLINVDMLVLNENEEVLLSWRKDEYCGIGWHIPGGIIRHGETIKEWLDITARNELHTDITFENLPCKITEIFNEQEYRNHFISLLFRGRCKRTGVDTVSENTSHKSGDLC